MNDGDVMPVGRFNNFRQRGFAVEADHFEIGLVGDQHQGDVVLIQRCLEVVQVDTVCGADLKQMRADWRMTSGMRKPPPISTAGCGDEDFPALCQGGKDQQDGAGIVVDDKTTLAPVRRVRSCAV